MPSLKKKTLSFLARRYFYPKYLEGSMQIAVVGKYNAGIK
jgi:hypothetical protein